MNYRHTTGEDYLLSERWKMEGGGCSSLNSIILLFANVIQQNSAIAYIVYFIA